ncbi:MAG TPA: ATP-binding protein [Myxococcota bacterium]|nr:ATP-binding protein [Myxococcota bacterium]
MARQSEIAGWILNSMSSGVVAIDSRGHVAMLNPGAQRILGCPAGAPSDALGIHCSEVLRAQPAIARLLLETLGARDALSRAELVLEGAAGRDESTIGFTLTPVRDPAGEVRAAAILFRDLTPLERIDERERLHERFAALGQMAAGLAHEIRNPLAGMEIVAGLLMRRLAERDEECALVAQLQGEIRSLARSVEACLEFVRPLSPERGPVDAVALVEQALEIALARASFGGSIERAFADEIPQPSADVDQLRAVITNLILNALEAMDAQGPQAEKRLGLEIAVASRAALGRRVALGSDGELGAAARPRRELVIRVSDSGPGIPSELREKIFYPFFTTKQRGSGVGLAIAQKIVAAHGGSLELEPATESGCSFRVRLPLEEPKP